MSSNVNDTYLESRVMSASPLELVRMLYEGARTAVREARRHLAAGEIQARSRQISKAMEIVSELSASLDEERGGDIAARLKALYDYVGRQLLDANLRQADAPLQEVQMLLETLEEGWRQAGGMAAESPLPPEPAARAAGEYAPISGYGALLSGTGFAMPSQSWSA